MFEVGRSLRDARRQRGIELDAAQRATHIRRRYLEALEAERFDLLPAPAYARGFLREYAEYLGLDGDVYVAEYDERFAPREEPALAPSRVRMPTRTVPGGVVTLVLAIVAVAIGLAAWSLGGGGKTRSVAATTPEQPAHHPKPPRSKPKHHAQPRPLPPPKPLVLTAARGDCWISVRVGSASGRVVYESTLRQGQTVAFGLQKPLVLRVGAGSNLDATANGRPIALPHLVGDVVVTRRGVG
jgi:cytoskeletal protein RodZ